MPEVKSTAATGEKWARVTPARSEDYKLGIQNPRRDWAAETAAAEATYITGVQNAHAKGMFKKGVARAGTAKWKEKALAKGPGRFAEGVTVGQADYQKGIAPYLEAIKAVNLGPRFPRRDPRNIDRVRKIDEALIAKKMSM